MVLIELYENVLVSQRPTAPSADEALCHILGFVDDFSFKSKSLTRVSRQFYRLLTYPPSGSGIWGAVPLDLTLLQVIQPQHWKLDWIAHRAAGVSSLVIKSRNNLYASTDYSRRDVGLARLLGMVSPWLEHVDVQLAGATFVHKSFDILTDPGLAWLTAAMREVRFESDMEGANRKFPQLLTLTNLTMLHALATPGLAQERILGLDSIPAALGDLKRLHSLRLDLRPECEGLPPEASALQALRILELRGGLGCIHGTAFSSLTSLESLTLDLGKQHPQSLLVRPDPEALGGAIAPLTRLTELRLTNSRLLAMPAQVFLLRRLAVLDCSANPGLGDKTTERFPAESAAAPDGRNRPWPPGFTTALTALTSLSLTHCGLRSLPPDMEQMTTLRVLHLGRNRLGGDKPNWPRLPPTAGASFAASEPGTEAPPAAIPALPLLEDLDLSFTGYKVLPPGLPALTALTRLRFVDVPMRTLPPLDALLKLPHLRTVNLVVEGMGCNTDSALRMGAFEARFLAARQARVRSEDLPVPRGQTAAANPSGLPPRSSGQSATSPAEPGPFDMPGCIVPTTSYPRAGWDEEVPGGPFIGPADGWEDEDEEEGSFDDEDDDDGMDHELELDAVDLEAQADIEMQWEMAAQAEEDAQHQMGLWQNLPE